MYPHHRLRLPGQGRRGSVRFPPRQARSKGSMGTRPQPISSAMTTRDRTALRGAFTSSFRVPPASISRRMNRPGGRQSALPLPSGFLPRIHVGEPFSFSKARAVFPWEAPPISNIIPESSPNENPCQYEQFRTVRNQPARSPVIPEFPAAFVEIIAKPKGCQQRAIPCTGWRATIPTAAKADQEIPHRNTPLVFGRCRKRCAEGRCPCLREGHHRTGGHPGRGGTPSPLGSPPVGRGGVQLRP